VYLSSGPTSQKSITRHIFVLMSEYDMPSRRSVLTTAGIALCTTTAGCASLPRLQTPRGTTWYASVPDPGTLAPPSTTDGLVAVGGLRDGRLDNGRIVVFDAETGEQRWRHDFGRMTGLTATGGSVYVGEKRGSRRARVLSFDASTGEERWTQTVENLASAMTVADGTLYTANGTLAALETEDGTIRWERAQVGDTGFTVVAAPDDQLGADARAVYYGDENGVVALSPGDGSPVWTWRPERWDWTDVGPTPVDDRIYVGGGGDVAALDGQTGAVHWRTSFGQDARVSGVHETGSSLLVAEGTDEAPSDTFGTIYELSLKDGRERYETRFETPVVQTASTSEAFVVGTSGGRVVWTDGASFFDRAESSIPGDGFVIGAAGKRAFVQTTDGTLWALLPPE
jgi:outer membrane protein assembly factor BamB